MQAELVARLNLSEAQARQLELNLQNHAYSELIAAVHALPDPGNPTVAALRHLATNPPESIDAALPVWISCAPVLLARYHPYLLPLAVRAGASLTTPYLIQTVVMHGLVDLLLEMFDLGANPDQEGSYDTPLKVAIINQHRAIVELLLDMGVNPNNPGAPGGKLPLQVALAGEDIHLAELLLFRGANWRDWPPHVIASLPPDRILWFLENTSYSPSNPPPREGVSVLEMIASRHYEWHHGARGEYTKVIQALLDRGADPAAFKWFEPRIREDFKL